MNAYTCSAKDKDSQFIKNLLDASEKHNKNLSELIVILKKSWKNKLVFIIDNLINLEQKMFILFLLQESNIIIQQINYKLKFQYHFFITPHQNIEEEKAKVARLTKENVELKRDLGSKQLSLKKIEKELLLSKQNEQKSNSLIKSLQDSLEKQRLQLLNQKNKGDENIAPTINSGSSLNNGLAERTNSISSLKYNHSSFLNNDTISQHNKRISKTQLDKQSEQIQKELDQISSNPSLNNANSNNLQQKTRQRYIQAPGNSDKENNSTFVTGEGSKQSIETTEQKRKQFYSIHQVSTYQQNQQMENTNNMNTDSLQKDQALESQQQIRQSDSQKFQKPTSNLRGASYNELDSIQSALNNVNTNVQCQSQISKDSHGSYLFYNSKIQTKEIPNSQQTPYTAKNQIGSQYHSRYASETFSQRFNQQITKNISPNTSKVEDASQIIQQGLNNIQNEVTSQQEQISQRGIIQKNENESQDCFKKNQGMNSVMNYLNSKQGQSPIFVSNQKNGKNTNYSTTEQQTESDIQLIIVTNQSEYFSPNRIRITEEQAMLCENRTLKEDDKFIKNNQSAKVDDKNIKSIYNIKSDDKSMKIEDKCIKSDYNADNHTRNNSLKNMTSNNPYIVNNQLKQNSNTHKNKSIFSDQTQQNSNINNQNQLLNPSQQIIQDNSINRQDQQDDSKYNLDKCSNYLNKKRIEEQVKSPKFLQKDVIQQQFQKINHVTGNQYSNKSVNTYIKSRHESIGINEGLYNSYRRGSTNENSSQSTQISQIQRNNNTVNNGNSNQNDQQEYQRSQSHQRKTLYYNNGKSKKEEDVTITVEDVVDTIANVEEDADEAANLENLSGSHFKFMMKTSCKNVKTKTEQYFSKMENPSVTAINKKKQEFQNQQQIYQQILPPSFGTYGNQNDNNQQINYYDNYDKSKISNHYDPYSFINNQNNQYNGTDQINLQDITANITPNPLFNTPNIYSNKFNTTQVNDTARLNTEEASKSVCEKHQSVEIYNQINNKMTNFKQISQVNNGSHSSISPRSQQAPSQQVENVLERKIKNKYSIHEKKEPGKMKKQLEENQITDIGNRMFEGLMIYGPDKNEIKNLKSTQTKEILSLSPQLYFKYPENSQIEKGREDVFQQFAFPFGVETQQICLTDSLSQLNEIIFSNNMAEANNNCFVFAIKSEESYKFQKNKEGSLFKQNEHQELLEICNPSNLLYGICFRFKEIIENGQSKNCWTTNKLFCFLTYYPFHRFFLDIISSMLNSMKMKRIEYFSKIQENIRHDPSVLSKLENEFFYNFLNKECKELLEELKNIALPSLSNRLQLNFNGENFAYQVPNREYAQYIEAEWGCSLVLSSFDKELFVNIFLSLLLEQSVVFVSRNSALLSSTMLLFHCLLKPFKWHHPLIFNLPNNFTHLMDIPVPILVGLNKDKNYVFKNNLAQKHENCLFVLLDDNIELLNYELISHISESYFYQHLLEKVSNYFDDLERDTLDDPNNANYSNQNDQSNNNMSNSQNSNYKDLLSHSNNNSSSSNNNNMLGSNTKKNSSIFQPARSKSFIMNAATDAFNSLLGSKNKTNKVISGNSQHQFLNSNSTHRRKKTIITYPNIEEKRACMKILSTCSDFLNQLIISQMPVTPIYQTNTNVLNFDEIEKQMTKNIGKSDSFLHNLLKSQLFTVYAEEKYEFMNI